MESLPGPQACLHVDSLKVEAEGDMAKPEPARRGSDEIPRKNDRKGQRTVSTVPFSTTLGLPASQYVSTRMVYAQDKDN